MTMLPTVVVVGTFSSCILRKCLTAQNDHFFCITSYNPNEQRIHNILVTGSNSIRKGFVLVANINWYCDSDNKNYY